MNFVLSVSESVTPGLIGVKKNAFRSDAVNKIAGIVGHQPVTIKFLGGLLCCGYQPVLVCFQVFDDEDILFRAQMGSHGKRLRGRNGDWCANI